MRRFFLAVVVVGLSSSAFCQTNTSGASSQQWPQDPPVGIGTEGASGGVLTPGISLQLHHKPSFGTPTQPAILWFSDGGSTSTNTHGILGLMPGSITTYSSLSQWNDLILHEHDNGDIILTNYWKQFSGTHSTGGSIRMATAGDSIYIPDTTGGFFHSQKDYERFTINPNGNIGIDLPPDSGSILATSHDQLQIGGGSFDAGGSRIPGLTIYGGNRWEGMPRNGGGTFPLDWRGITFNHWEDHFTGVGTRFTEAAWSHLAFGTDEGGMVRLAAYPYHSSCPMTVDSDELALQLNGQKGLEFWSDEEMKGGARYYHLLVVWRPGYGTNRNEHGLCYHHTPVYIGLGGDVNFDSLPVNPITGDGKTWMLAVEGAALFKEAFVSMDWPDYVFDADYKLPSLNEVERFIETNHHLPGVPSAKEMAKTGVPLGKTEAKMMEKIEELTKYVIEQNKKIEALEHKINDLQQGGK